MKPSDHDLHLEELKEKSIGRLLSADSFNLPAFNELYLYLCQKSELIKSEHVISKQVIAILLLAQRSIENSSSHNAEARKNISMASQFSMLLELMSRGESPSDRKPGVPRVV